MPVDVERMLDLPGGLGRYQLVVLVMSCYSTMVMAMHALILVFVAMAPAFPGGDRCPMPPVPPEHRGLSIVVDWALTCDRKALLAGIFVAYFVGFFVGAPGGGYLADRVGRRVCMILASVLLTAGALWCAASQEPIAFACARGLVGFSAGALSVSHFVHTIEFMGSRRTMVAAIGALSFAGGICLLTLVAYFVRPWRDLLMVAFWATVPLIGMTWWVRESPKWEAALGMDVTETLHFLARFDGRPVPSILFEPPKEGPREDLFVLMRHPLAMRLAIMALAWASVSMAYYALAMGVESIGTDIYVSSILGAMAELPAVAMFFCLADSAYVGRRLMTVVCFVVAGGLCAMGALLRPGSVELLISVIVSRFCISAAFTVLYIWGAELFPTAARNGALGIQSMFARIGGIAASVVLVYAEAPLLYVAIPCIVAGLLCILVHETAGQPLPDTLEDVVNHEKLPVVDKGKGV
mmetsp:Transcript_88113/g.235759  ORF Transcript_88113/g.235759 Transcript_88113/m.235759 type:complete len:466 (+) Transcript_88113:101-1498(+)